MMLNFFRMGYEQKKKYFLPTVTNGTTFDKVNSVTIDTEYVDGRDKERLCMPDRAFKKGIPKWNLQKTCDGNVFTWSVK